MCESETYNIVLIEANKLCQVTFSRMINSLKEFKISHKFDNVKDALIAIYNNSDNIDIVILDLDLPNFDGLLASKLIKKINNKIKILILTPDSDDSNILTSLLASAEGYYMRDFSSKTLSKVLLDIVNNQTVIDLRIRYKLWKHIDTSSNNHMQITFYNDDEFLKNIKNLELESEIKSK